MKKCGIHINKGKINRQIATYNKLLKEFRERIRCYSYSKAVVEKPEG